MRAWAIALIGVSTVLIIPSLVFLCVKGLYVDASTVGYGASAEASLYFRNIHRPFFIFSLLLTIGSLIFGGFTFFYYIGDDCDLNEHKFIFMIVLAGLLLISALLVLILPGNLGTNPLFYSDKSNVENIEVALGSAGNAFVIIRLLSILGFAGSAVLSFLDMY